MAQTLPSLDAGEDIGVGPDRRETTGTSRWQKAVGIIGVVVVLWVGSNLFDTVTAGGDGPGGGPGGHGPPGSTPPAGSTEDGDQTPPGGDPMDHG